jgi:hypothetical protein
VFYIDVAKVDRDVAHVAMAIHICFKCMFQMFYPFQTYSASVSFGCCKTRSGFLYIYASVLGVFIRMLQVFYLDVCNGYTCFHVFSQCFASVSDVCCKCFSCFGRMLQVFHLDVAK